MSRKQRAQGLFDYNSNLFVLWPLGVTDQMRNPIAALGDFISVNLRERRTTFALARLELKKEYGGAALGKGWAVIRPITFISVYWFAVEIGLRGSRTMPGDLPYLVWLVPGIFAWFFVTAVLNTGGKSVRAHSHLVTRMVFPVETIPVFTVLSLFLVHLALMIGVVCIYFFLGYAQDLFVLQLLYYFFASFVFGCVTATFISALTTISKDIVYLMKSIVQMLFWLSPNLWPLSNLNGTLRTAVMLNPVAYLVEGYRGALVYDTSFGDQWLYHLYFWGFMTIFSLVTAQVWTRLRPEFADVL